MSWTTHRTVEFQHCDPAGIVFYPRYFEMINSVIEEFFKDHVGYGFAPMHFDDKRGVPTVKTSVAFQAPSRLDDRLAFTLDVDRVGNSSVDFRITCLCDGQTRMTVATRLVHFDMVAGKSVAWSDKVRQKLAHQSGENND